MLAFRSCLILFTNLSMSAPLYSTVRKHAYVSTCCHIHTNSVEANAPNESDVILASVYCPDTQYPDK